MGNARKQEGGRTNVAIQPPPPDNARGYTGTMASRRRVVIPRAPFGDMRADL